MLRVKLDEFREVLENDYDLGHMSREEHGPIREAFRTLYLSIKQEEKSLDAIVTEDKANTAKAQIRKMFEQKGYTLHFAKTGEAEDWFYTIAYYDSFDNDWVKDCGHGHFDNLNDARKKCNELMETLDKGCKSCGEHYSVFMWTTDETKEVFRPNIVR